MDKLISQLKALVASSDSRWTLDEHGSEIIVNADGRRQSITFERRDELYVLTSVVLSATEVTSNVRRWRELARLAWQRNAEQELVTFGFDKKERLIGQIQHPERYLDREEVEVYIEALARECDRFEYLLSGQDQF